MDRPPGRFFRVLIGLLTLALVLAHASPTFADVPRALLYLWEPFPEFGDGQVVDIVLATAVNSVGGHMALAEIGPLSFPQTSIDHASIFWGSDSPVHESVLRSEQYVSGLYQTWFFPGMGLSDAGEIAYQTTSETTPDGNQRLSAVWRDDELLALEDSPHPSLPEYWTFLDEVRITANGLVSWYGELSSSVGGPITSSGFFVGDSATPVVYTGDVLPHLPYPLATIISHSHRIRFSPFGTHWIAIVEMAYAAEPLVVVIDGEGVTRDGELYQKGEPVPPSVGAPPNSLWSFFDDIQINDSGDWFCRAIIDTVPPLGYGGGYQVLLKNGVIYTHQGEVLEGRELVEGGWDIAMNQDGDVAYPWDFRVGTTLDYMLILNRKVILTENDPIDMDGDGLPESEYFRRLVGGPGYRLTLSDRDAQGNVSLTMTAATSLHAWASVPSAYLMMTVNTAETTGASLPSRPADVSSLDASPSPFMHRTRIRFRSPMKGPVALSIVDATGRLVRRLVRRGEPADRSSVWWNGRDDSGSDVASGVYFVVFETAAGTETCKLVRLR